MTEIQKIALRAIATAQHADMVCAYVDAEHQFNVSEAIARSIVMADLLVSTPDDETQAAEIVDTLVRTGAIGLIVIAGFVGILPTTMKHAEKTTTAILFI